MAAIDGDDVVFVDHRAHGGAADAEAIGFFWIGAPQIRGAEHFGDGNRVKIKDLIAFGAVGGGMGSEDWDSDQAGFFRHGAEPVVDAGSDNFKVRKFCAAKLAMAFGEHAREIVAFEPGAGPEPPTLRLASDIAKLDVTLRGRFVSAALPAGESHGGIVQPGSEGGLSQAHGLTQGDDLA